LQIVAQRASFVLTVFEDALRISKDNSLSEVDVLKRLQVFAILVVMAGLAAVPAIAGPSAPMGIVTSAQHAVIGHVSATDGTSIYDGDVVSTEATGALRLQFGGSQMVLTGNTVVSLSKTDAGVIATVMSGAVRFSSVPGSPLEVRTLKAVVIHSKGDQAAVGQLSVTGPTSFQIGSTKGDLDVAVNGVEHVVEASTAYNVSLDGDNGGSDKRKGSPAAAGKSGGIWIAVAAIAAGTAVAIWLAFRSPSRP
jgi:hypothetical protein